MKFASKGDQMPSSIDHFLWLRSLFIKVRRPIYRFVLGVDIPPTASVSFSAQFRVSERGPVTIGAHTLIAFKTLMLGFDVSTGREGPVVIGRNCFIGGGSIIMPGCTVGDGSIIGAGSVVVGDIPPDCIAIGNPARVLKTGIGAGPKGRLPGADAAAREAKRLANRADPLPSVRTPGDR